MDEIFEVARGFFWWLISFWWKRVRIYRSRRRWLPGNIALLFADTPPSLCMCFRGGFLFLFLFFQSIADRIGSDAHIHVGSTLHDTFLRLALHFSCPDT